MSDIQATDECYRCGYDLRGITDAQPCPECGLLAERSRRATDELHLTRPTWLRRLSIGVWVILFGLLAAPLVTFLFLQKRIHLYTYNIPNSLRLYLETLLALSGLLLGAIALAIGAWLVATPEGFAPSDETDRRRRWIIRLLPLVIIGGIFLQAYAVILRLGGRSPTSNYLPTIVMATVLLIVTPLPFSLFMQFRSLARRARHAHLAEHCAIVGVGTSVAIAYIAIALLIPSYAKQLGLGEHWVERSQAVILLQALIGVAIVMIALWSIYLMSLFAIAFRRASNELHKTWTRDDKSLQLD